MDTTTAPFLPGDPVTDDAVLLEFAAFMAQVATPGRRSLVLAWLDADDRTSGVVVPIEEIPAIPDLAAAEGLGRLMAGVLADHAPGGSVVAVLARAGSPLVGDSDRVWNRVLRGQDQAPVRHFFIATQGGVRPLTLDDAV